MTAPKTVRIDRIGAEGDGLGRLPDGTLLYVRGALPGELVTVRVTAKRGDGLAAELGSVLEPSPERAAPPCPHFGACGGCALQHWREAPYRAWKSGLLESALRRAGYAPTLAPLATTPPRARRRMDLAYARGRLGLHAAGSSAIVDLQSCAVLHPALAILLAPLRALCGELGAMRRGGSVIANLLREGPDLLLRSGTAPDAIDRARLADFARTHGIPRIAWSGEGNAPETACQLGPATIAFGDIVVAPPPGAFLQASAEGEAAIRAGVLAGLPDKLPAKARISELYAGCGTLSFALAARARVSAYEGDAAACAALAQAANRHGLATRVSVTQRDLARRPLLPAELSGAAAVVLDPPHAGAAAQMPHIAAAKVPCVIYVSCNPATLARDAAVLRAAGYALTSATPIDQFLWSARLESVCVFRR
jgi:23S rRNA (uracil1939-C5)-methyltransferase